jgi:hypothetical protein
MNEDAFTPAAKVTGRAVFDDATLHWTKRAGQVVTVSADLIGDDRNSGKRLLVKGFLKGSPLSVLEQWLETHGKPQVDDLSAFMVLEVLKPAVNLKDVREESGFVVVETEDSSGVFAYLFDDKFMAVSDGHKRLMMVHPNSQRTRVFEFGPAVAEKVSKLAGLRTAKPAVFDVLQQASTT